MFGKKKTINPIVEFDPDTQYPILKCSICNGEQVAGFKDKQNGKFTEVMLIKDRGDLEMFLKMYNLADVAKEY